MIINPDNNSTIWYHYTNKNNVKSILQDGLKVFSKSERSYSRVPWLYITSKVTETDKAIFAVDLAGFDSNLVVEVFGGRVNECIYQRIFVDISPERLTLISNNVNC